MSGLEEDKLARLIPVEKERERTTAEEKIRHSVSPQFIWHSSTGGGQDLLDLFTDIFSWPQLAGQISTHCYGKFKNKNEDFLKVSDLCCEEILL